MNWKQFYKPTLIKVMLFLMFAIIAFCIMPTNLKPIREIDAVAYVGFPFPIISAIKKAATSYQFIKLYPMGIIGNTIIWYTFVSYITYLYNKHDKRKGIK